VRRQIEAILSAWGMRADCVAAAAEVMTETDLRGVDSHGITMLLRYDEARRLGAFNWAPDIRVEQETPATALIDADRSLGHAPALRAIDLAIDKARALGVGAVAVRNSDHFGAAGAYALRAARQGLIGIATTNASVPAVVPTRSTVPLFSTNPIAFAAPAATRRPFVLDMATSTVAVGKVNVAWLNDRPLPAGWVVDEAGRPVTDAALGRDYIYKRLEGGLTPLGGAEETGGYKGYGLCAMVEILSAVLAGATAMPLHPGGTHTKAHRDVGHFFIALDPGAFRPRAAFLAEMDAFIDALHNAPAADPARPVLVPGDPEWAHYDDRAALGVPLPLKLVEALRELARAANAPFLLPQPPRMA